MKNVHRANCNGNTDCACPNSKAYIGDSIYAEVKPAPFAGTELVITTEDGTSEPSNRIVFGLGEWTALVGFMNQWTRQHK